MSTESFMTELYDDVAVSEVIRPAAIIPEVAARAILVELALSDAHNGGLWVADPSRWVRYDRPWQSQHAPGTAQVLGTVQVAYGTPTRYEITIYRVTITTFGTQCGWTVTNLCDAVLEPSGLTLASCPRAELATPPKPFQY